MASKFIIETILKAVDKVSAPVKKIANNMAPLGRQFQSIGKNAANFGKNIKGLLSPLALIGSVASVAGMTAMIKGVADYGDTIANTANRVGWSTKALQEYSYAAKFANMSSEDFQGSLDMMAKRMGQLQSGVGPLATKLGKISPVLQDQIKNAKNNEEAFDMMIAAIQKVDDPNRKIQLAELFFGDANMIHFADMTAEQLEELKKQANIKGLVLDEEALKNAEVFNDSIDSLKASLFGLAATIGSKLLPIITPIIAKIETWINANREMIGIGFEKFVAQVSESLSKVDFDAVIDGVTSFISKIGGFIDMIGGAGNAIIGLVVILNGPLIASFMGLIGSVLRMGKVFASVAGGPVTIAIMAIVALATLLIKNWDTVKGWFVSFADFLIDVWTGIKSKISGILEAIKGVFSAVWDGIKGAFSAAIDFIKSILSALNPINLLMGNWNPLGGFFSGIWDNVENIASKALEFIKTIMSAFNPLSLIIDNWEPITNFFAGMWDKIKDIFSGAWTFIKDTVSKIGDWVLEKSGINKIIGLIDKVRGWFSGGEEPDLSSPEAAAASAAPTSTNIDMADAMRGRDAKANVTVSFENLPKGATVNSEASGDGMDLGTYSGYAMNSGVSW